MSKALDLTLSEFIAAQKTTHRDALQTLGCHQDRQAMHTVELMWASQWYRHQAERMARMSAQTSPLNDEALEVLGEPPMEKQSSTTLHQYLVAGRVNTDDLEQAPFQARIVEAENRSQAATIFRDFLSQGLEAPVEVSISQAERLEIAVNKRIRQDELSMQTEPAATDLDDYEPGGNAP